MRPSINQIDLFENYEFKPAVIGLKIKIVSHPPVVEGSDKYV